MKQLEMLKDKYDISLESLNKITTLLNTGEVFLIAMSGKIASGKDTNALFLQESLTKKGKPTIITSFAKSLREEVNSILGLRVKLSVKELAEKFNTQEECIIKLFDIVGDIEELSTHTQTDRLALQYWGVQVRRAQDENYWVKQGLKRIEESLLSGTSVIFSDARFPNEVELVDSLGGKVVRLSISQQEQIRRIELRDGFTPKLEQLNHRSETALDDYKFKNIIESNDDLQITQNDVLNFVFS